MHSHSILPLVETKLVLTGNLIEEKGRNFRNVPKQLRGVGLSMLHMAWECLKEIISDTWSMVISSIPNAHNKREPQKIMASIL